MNTFEANGIARATIEDRIREANHQRLVRECQRREQPSTARTPVQEPRHHSRLWSLVHFRQAYS